MKMLKSLLVILAVVGAGQTMCPSAVAEARRTQAAETATENEAQVKKLAEMATEEMVRVRTATLVPFGPDFKYLELETKYETALATIKAENQQASRNLAQARKALKAFQLDYKKNKLAYLHGVTKFPAFNIEALVAVVEFTQKIKAQLLASLSVEDAVPQLVEVEATEEA